MPAVPKDFTFHQPAAEFTELCRRLAEHGVENGEKAPVSDSYSRACTLEIPLAPPVLPTGADEEAWPATFTGRALACRCFGGEYASVTCRDLGPAAGAASACAAVRWPGAPVQVVEAMEAGPAVPPPAPAQEAVATAPKSAEEQSTDELVGELWRLLGLDKRPVTGLIVIAGRTGSGKSVIARSFIKRYLAHCGRDSPVRRPHLVTYEDPIEHRFAAGPREGVEQGFDYTPREKLIDVGSLEDATMDALRQTPALFFVGETREPEDWKTLLQFAGTGHLAITTGHAGSLVETMAQIIQAMKARTPAERSRVAGRIAALVHIRPYPIDPRTKVLIPAFWSRTPRSISAFTAEGLGSMLPNQARKREAPPASDGTSVGKDPDHQPPGSYGRAYAVESLSYLDGIPGLKRKSIEWDLRGE